MHFFSVFIINPCCLTSQKKMNHSEEGIFQISCEIVGVKHFVIANLQSQKVAMINHIFAITVNGILIIPTILLNAVAIITILKFSQLYSKACYFIILLQSIIDLIVGTLSIPLVMFVLVNALKKNSDCIFATLAYRLAIVPMGISVIMLCVLTLERYIAIIHPYSYNVQVTRKRLLMCFGFSTAAFFSIMTLSLRNERLIVICGTIVATTAFLFNAFAYTKICLAVKKCVRSQKKINAALGAENLTRMKLFLQEIRRARSCFMVIICYCALSFLPNAVVVPFYDSMNTSEYLGTVAWLLTIGHLNSIVNSIIFFWSKKMLRKQATKLFIRTSLN